MTLANMRMAVLAVLLFIANAAFAQDGPDCFSKFTHFNICEKAREYQHALAATLPMNLSANITLSTVAVIGPRVSITAIWHTSKADMDTSLGAGNMSHSDFEKRMDQLTRNSVCSQNAMAAFVRLGGQMQYIYKTEDQFVVLSPTVTNCPD
jgi:hypothetical protein